MERRFRSHVVLCTSIVQVGGAVSWPEAHAEQKKTSNMVLRYYSYGLFCSARTNIRETISRAALSQAAASSDPLGERYNWRVSEIAGCGCNVKQNVDKPEGLLRCCIPTDVEDIGGGFSVQRAMATRACYVPMLGDSYTCNTVHDLAIWGRRTFQRLKGHVSENPGCVSLRDSEGNTALILACAAHEQTVAVVKYLLEQDHLGLVNAENYEGLTALHFAVLNKRPDIVQLLLHNQADINAGSKQVGGKKFGLTPLHLSLIDPWSPCVDVLLDNGADITVEMLSPRDICLSAATVNLECECGGCFMLTWKNGLWVVPPALMYDTEWVSRGPALNVAVDMGAVSSVKSLLERFKDGGTLDINHSDGEGMSPLCRAANQGYAGLVKMLVENGADVNHRYSYASVANVTPLHAILSFGRYTDDREFQCDWCFRVYPGDDRDMIRLADPLLDSGTLDVNATNGRVETLLSIAVTSGHDFAVQRLLQRGADPLIADIRGDSPLSRACNLHPPSLRFTIVRLLLKTGVHHDISAICLGTDVTSAQFAVLANRDYITLSTLHRRGAVRQKNLRTMLNAIQTAEARVEDDDDSARVNDDAGPAIQSVLEREEMERKGLEAFRQKILELLSSPKSLLDSCLIHFSRRAGVEPWGRRVAALKAMDPEGDEDLWRNLLEPLFKKHDLI